MASRRKQEENHLKILKNLLAQPSNKKCLECDQRGPTYVDVTIGSFVCTSCGGILRGLNPPHRVKSISMTTFTPAEISFIECHGNEWCHAVYLAKYDEQSRAKPESRSDHSKLKYFMELKYEQKKWYESPSQQRKLMESAAAKKNKENPPPAVKPLQSLLGKNFSVVQIPSAKQEISHGIRARKDVKPSSDLLGGISPPATTPSSFQNHQKTGVSGSSDAFADFDSAFGAFSPPPVSSSPSTFAAFGQISAQPIAFTTNTATQSSTQEKSEPPGNNVLDKYAALADLDFAFNKVEPQPATEKMSEFLWSSPSKPSQPSSVLQPSQPNPVFLTQPQQCSSFSSGPVNTANSLSWSASGTWNTGFPEQPVVQPMGATISNPFFNLPSTMSAQHGTSHSEYGAWTQPPQQIPVQMTNSAAMSSTNPFNMGANNANQQSYFQQTQSVNPISNPSNPFMF